MSSNFDPTRPLFKYTKREFADLMMRQGKFRIGTLHDFRRVEKHGVAISDPYEGISNVIEHVEHADSRDIQKNPFVASFFGGSSDAQIEIHDCTFIWAEDSPDYFVYCTTRTPTAEGLQEFGNNACVRIEDPLEFARLLTEKMQQKGLATRGFIGACAYGDRSRPWHEAVQLPSAFVKDAEFEYQAEVRFVWEPTSRPLPSHVEVECPAAATLLSLHEILGADQPARAQSRHALQFDNEELLRRTYALVDEVLYLLEELRSMESVDTPSPLRHPFGYDPEQMREFFRAAHEEQSRHFREVHEAQTRELNRRLGAGLLREMSQVVKDYANRGLRDRRIESAIGARPNLAAMKDVPSPFQRLAEMLEIQLAREAGRQFTFEREPSYRFWQGRTCHLSPNNISHLILRGQAERLHIQPAPDPGPYGSERRHKSYVLALEVQVRKALAALVRAGGAAPSEVIDFLSKWEENR